MLPPSSPLITGMGRSPVGWALAVWLIAEVLHGAAIAAPHVSDLHRDEEIVFFPTLAHRFAVGTTGNVKSVAASTSQRTAAWSWACCAARSISSTSK